MSRIGFRGSFPYDTQCLFPDCFADYAQVREHKHIRHSDVFQDFIMPRMKVPREDWDNKCTEEQVGATTLKSCVQVCEEDSACLQYLFSEKTQKCMTSRDPQLGQRAPQGGLQSGWMFDRIERWKDARPACDEPRWITSNADTHLA